MVDDNVKFTTVYAVLPNSNSLSYDYFQPLTEGSRHEVFISHIPEPSLGYKVQMCVQVVSVSPSSLQLPGLSARMASVYNVRRSEEMWNLIGVVAPGLVCAVGDREGGWYRGVVVECVKERLVMVQYVTK